MNIYCSWNEYFAKRCSLIFSWKKTKIIEVEHNCDNFNISSFCFFFSLKTTLISVEKSICFTKNVIHCIEFVRLILILWTVCIFMRDNTMNDELISKLNALYQQWVFSRFFFFQYSAQRLWISSILKNYFQLNFFLMSNTF